MKRHHLLVVAGMLAGCQTPPTNGVASRSGARIDYRESAYSLPQAGQVSGIAELVLRLYPDPLPKNLEFRVEVLSGDRSLGSSLRVETIVPSRRTRYVERRPQGIVVASLSSFGDAKVVSAGAGPSRRLEKIFRMLDGSVGYPLRTLSLRMSSEGTLVDVTSSPPMPRGHTGFLFDAHDHLVRLLPGE